MHSELGGHSVVECRVLESTGCLPYQVLEDEVSGQPVRKTSTRAAKNLVEIFADALKTTHLRTCSSGVFGSGKLGPTLRTPLLRSSQVISALQTKCSSMYNDSVQRVHPYHSYEKPNKAAGRTQHNRAANHDQYFSDVRPPDKHELKKNRCHIVRGIEKAPPECRPLVLAQHSPVDRNQDWANGTERYFPPNRG